MDELVPCVLSTRFRNNSGYPLRFIGTRADGFRVQERRFVYAEAHGPIADDVRIDHLCHELDAACPGGKECRHRRCVEISHLKAVPGGRRVPSPRLVGADLVMARTRREPGGCWIWTGRTDRAGYSRGGHDGPAYRYSYETFVGPIPTGLEIDHLCNNKACVNPEHLEPVTRAENTRRRDVRNAEAMAAANGLRLVAHEESPLCGARRTPKSLTRCEFPPDHILGSATDNPIRVHYHHGRDRAGRWQSWDEVPDATVS